MITAIATAILTDCLTSVCVAASSSLVHKASQSIRETQAVQLVHVADFWENRVQTLTPGMRVQIQGSLSRFVPMLIGPPKVKRDLHREYRRSIPPADLEKGKATVDANLAYTAGQMVWRFNIPDYDWKFLGLYQSIVRNSIPVIVERKLYESKIRKMLEDGKQAGTIEALLTGYVSKLPDNAMKRFIEQNNLSGRICPELIQKASGPLYCIQVAGRGAGVEMLGPSRYLDGDIWVALEEDGKQFFVSRFLDIADVQDLAAETRALELDVANMHPNADIVFQYDQVDKTIPDREQHFTMGDLASRFLCD